MIFAKNSSRNLKLKEGYLILRLNCKGKSHFCSRAVSIGINDLDEYEKIIDLPRRSAINPNPDFKEENATIILPLHRNN
jgi:hypothetical protein